MSARTPRGTQTIAKRIISGTVVLNRAVSLTFLRYVMSKHTSWETDRSGLSRSGCAVVDGTGIRIVAKDSPWNETTVGSCRYASIRVEVLSMFLKSMCGVNGNPSTQINAPILQKELPTHRNVTTSFHTIEILSTTAALELCTLRDA